MADVSSWTNGLSMRPSTAWRSGSGRFCVSVTDPVRDHRGSPLVHVIVLNWNGLQDTIACLESCRMISYPRFELIVVDNGSTDGSETRLREQFPEVEVLQTGRNLGFTGGNNVGIRRALERGSDYVVLL